MTQLIKWIPGSFLLLLWGCNIDGGVKNIMPLFKKDTTHQYEKENTLFAFVGEKISISPVPPKPDDFDKAIKAKYLIIKRIYGNHEGDTVEFEARDPYGQFEFPMYNHALLYVSEYEGTLYQEKFLYDAVFKTKDGRWAGAYSDQYKRADIAKTNLKPEKIDFAEKVGYLTRMKDSTGKEYTWLYPEPYYKIVGDTAFAVYGNYVPELFILKKEGILSERKRFGPPHF